LPHVLRIQRNSQEIILLHRFYNYTLSLSFCRVYQANALCAVISLCPVYFSSPTTLRFPLTTLATRNHQSIY